jgi:hypothetical protein
LRLRFGLLEITVFSFFNNLEEVKFSLSIQYAERCIGT